MSLAYDFPEGWTWSEIGSLTKNFDGKRIPLKAQDRAAMQGHFPYYGASGVIDSVNDYLFDGTYLLITEDGDLLSRRIPIAFEVSGKFWVNNCQGRRQNIPVGRSKSVPPERSLASVNVRASCSGEVSQRQAGSRLGG